MGIYLPNMEMTIDGNETIIRIQPDGTVLDQYGHHLATTAGPVPPHGRLIDADAFLALINDSTILSDFIKCIINPLIRGEPTVIEAEEGET